MRTVKIITSIIVVSMACAAWAVDQNSITVKPAADRNTIMINQLYPDLFTGSLTYAEIAELPEGILIKSSDITVTKTDITSQIAKAPQNIQEQLKKNEFFFVEQFSTQKFLLAMAKKDASDNNTMPLGKTDDEIIQTYLEKLAKQMPINVTDQEVQQFYEENKDACGGAALDQMKDQIKNYVLAQKQQTAVNDYLKTLGQRLPIKVSSIWAREQSVLAKDNPVDKARASGKPSVVDFGATGCRPCDMMAPILTTLKEKYAGKANVLFVHVREEQILASRYGVQSIPIQVFFDRDGKEIFRHVGFYPQAEIEKKLTEMGPK